MRRPADLLAAAVAAALVGGLHASAAEPFRLPQARVESEIAPAKPIRAAFYYPWFPNAWRQRGLSPYTRYRPTLGSYDSGSPRLIRAHVRALEYGRIRVGIASWWGRGHHTDGRIPTILRWTRAASATFRWTLYYEAEAQRDPDVEIIRADLSYIASRYGGRPAFLRLGGRFVVFVYASPSDGCEMAERWSRANTAGAYVVLKVFSGYRACPAQPDSWHQYAPAVPADRQAGFSYSISPGFAKADETEERLPRDLARWRRNVRAMIASRAPWQLVTTFNEWGEGSAVESAREWATGSGFGAYLDALHVDGRIPAPRRGR